MNEFLKHSVRFVLFVLAQVFIFSKVEIAYGMHIMVYPLFIFLLPVNFSPILLMFIALIFGFSIDVLLGNSFGLHASSAVFVAFIRGPLLRFFSTRDGYPEGLEVNMYAFGIGWFLLAFGTCLILHCLWFFGVEIFKLNDFWFIIQKTLVSAPIAFLVAIMLQTVFFKKSVER